MQGHFLVFEVYHLVADWNLCLRGSESIWSFSQVTELFLSESGAVGEVIRHIQFRDFGVNVSEAPFEVPFQTAEV